VRDEIVEDAKTSAITRRQLLAGTSIGAGVFLIEAVGLSQPASAAPAWVKPLDSPITYTQTWVGNGNYPYEPDGKHRALDMVRPGYANSPIYAMAAGTVVQAGWRDYLGYCVTIRHVDSYYTMYAHMRQTLRVSTGDVVTAGQRVGTLGATATEDPHLHLEMYQGGWDRHPSGGDRIDPETIVRNAPYPSETPQQPSGEDVPEYISKFATATQTIGASWANLKVNDDDVSLTAAGINNNVSHVTVNNLPPGEVIQFRFLQVDDITGANPVQLAVIEVLGTDGQTFAQLSCNIDLGSAKRLRLQAQTAATGVTITRVASRILRFV